MTFEQPSVQPPIKSPEDEAAGAMNFIGEGLRRKTDESEAKPGDKPEKEKKLETFTEYFKQSSSLKNEFRGLSPKQPDKSHPYAKFLEILQDARNAVNPLFAERILSRDKLALYQKNQKGPGAFKLTQKDLKKKQGKNWQEWRHSCVVNAEIAFRVTEMQATGEITDSLDKNIDQIPDALRQKLTDSIEQGQRLLEELKKQELGKRLNPKNVDQALKNGRPIEIKVLRKGAIEPEDGWYIQKITESGLAQVYKYAKDERGRDNYMSKNVLVEDLKQWNKDISSPSTTPELNERISACQDWQELYAYLDSRGGIQGSKDFYSAEEEKKIIEAVKSSKKDLTAVTQTGGLRQKVKNLLASEKQQKGPKKILRRATIFVKKSLSR